MQDYLALRCASVNSVRITMSHVHTKILKSVTMKMNPESFSNLFTLIDFPDIYYFCRFFFKILFNIFFKSNLISNFLHQYFF